MKKLLLACSLLALSSASYAQNFYAAASVGGGKSSYDCAGTSSCDLNDTTFKGTFGYKINDTFSVEGVYFDLGKAVADVGTIRGEVKSSGYGLRGLVAFPFGQNFSGFVSLGINQVKSDINVAVGQVSGEVSEKSVQPSASFGVDYAFSENLGLRAEIESHRFKDVADQNYNVVSGSVGLKFSF